ncbi:hypothetical protein [Parasphingopyxis marina]|uniref:SH3 domain-containing protein n=1 Tax=Parasphingopyxis marina TaxID=2761622 RepID=A0A842HUB6_9SPHN|nr:hypothetical protein [Parasphingopyxis marina]MBC2776123.1 hypothetical protein [Parasphingopyxis marina]
MRKFVTAGVLGCAVFALGHSPALADDDDEALEPFRACGTLTDNTARLACFDQALAGAATAQAERQARRQRRRAEDFGLSAIQIEERYDREIERAERSGDADALAAAEALEPAEPEEVTSPITETLVDSTRRRVFLLENGQIWREGNNSSLRGRIRVGSIATVSRGGLGGFRLRVEGRTGFISVSRIR